MSILDTLKGIYRGDGDKEGEDAPEGQNLATIVDMDPEEVFPQEQEEEL